MEFLLLLSSIIIYWLCLGLLFWRFSFDHHKTISDHVAKAPEKYFYNIVGLVTVSIICGLAFFWIFPEYDMPTFGYVCITLIYVGFVLSVLIPRVERKILAHDIIAAAFGTLAFLSILMLFFRSKDPTSAWMLGIALVAMTSTGPMLLNKRKKHYLYYQMVFYGCYFLAILIAAAAI